MPFFTVGGHRHNPKQCIVILLILLSLFKIICKNIYPQYRPKIQCTQTHIRKYTHTHHCFAKPGYSRWQTPSGRRAAGSPGCQRRGLSPGRGEQSTCDWWRRPASPRQWRGPAWGPPGARGSPDPEDPAQDDASGGRGRHATNTQDNTVMTWWWPWRENTQIHPK